MVTNLIWPCLRIKVKVQNWHDTWLSHDMLNIHAEKKRDSALYVEGMELECIDWRNISPFTWFKSKRPFKKNSRHEIKDNTILTCVNVFTLNIIVLQLKNNNIKHVKFKLKFYAFTCSINLWNTDISCCYF